MTTETMEQLNYMGQAMNPEPDNIRLSVIADALREGRSVVVVLEPGDATKYRLLLTPCWALGVCYELGDIGIPPQNSHDYLLVTKFDGHSGDAFFAYADVQHFDISVSNEWSCELLAWWLRILWKQLVPDLQPIEDMG